MVGLAGYQVPPRRPVVASPQLFRMPGPCFACGEMGHIRSRCPKTGSSDVPDPRKWYPFHCGAKFTLGDSVKSKCIERESVNEESDSVELVKPEQREVIMCERQLELVDVCTWEVEMLDVAVTTRVKGRLKERLSYWKDELDASAFVLDVIEHGYVLPLKSEPTPFVDENQASVLANKEFVEESVKELLMAGCVKQAEFVPHVCSPLSVVESKAGKKWLVLNLRHLNRFLWKQKFKYEDLRIAMLLLEKGDYLFSVDLKSGYHHVEIADIHHKYLGFAWNKKFYTFMVLPFGLASACYIFTKLLRPLVRYWRAKGLRIVIYLDDGLCAVADYTPAVEAGLLFCSTLDQAGFVAHPTKSKWEPTQRLVWLGFVIDLALGQIEVPQEKITSLQKVLRQLSPATFIQARKIASIIGQIISMGLAIGPVSRFMTRSLYATLESRRAWCEWLCLSPEAWNEIAFWQECLTEYKAQPIWHSPSAVRVVYSDASDTGYGGYVVEHGPCVVHGQWTAEEAKQSSTWRELTAVLRVLEALSAKLSNMQVRWFSDNQNVVRISHVGSKKAHLQEVALKVFPCQFDP